MNASASKSRRAGVPGLLAASLAVLGFVLLIGANYGLAVLRDIGAGLPPAPAVASLPVSTQVVDRDGRLLRPFTTKEGHWRLPVALADVDPLFLRMLLAYEDQRFYEHEGIDWSGITRAAVQFVGAGGRIVSGGSTLTMQLARLLDNGATRHIEGKLRQMMHAQRLETELGKDEILTLYLTLAPYGGNLEGVRAASLAWFGKEPRRLSLAEAALLVALPQSPEARRPDRDAAAAMASRNMVLDRLARQGVIALGEAEAAKREPVPLQRRDFPMLAPHLAQAALATHPGIREVGLTVERRLQEALEKLAAVRAREVGNQVSVAIVVADQSIGAIRASVGSAGLFDAEGDGFIDMTAALRSPGSTLKPLIYGLAFELGLAHPESLIEDRPTAFRNYVPVNFDGFSRGTVTIRQALTQSLNIPAVVVLDAVGTARLVARIRRAHANPVLPYDTAPSLAIGLGGVGITLRDLVSIYASIARGGAPVQLYDGVASVPETSSIAPPVLDPLAAWYVADILRDVAPPNNGAPGRIAYKTGTSYGYRDAWAIGFDGSTVIGVWVGRPDNAPVPGITGIGAAAPILFEAFDRLGGDPAPFRKAPPGTLIATNPELPEPLRRFRHPDVQVTRRDAAPEIAYPADGTEVDLGLALGDTAPLVVKIRNGVPPFTLYADGAPVGRAAFSRQARLDPAGPGYVTLSVVDARGRSDRVKVFLQ